MSSTTSGYRGRDYSYQYPKKNRILNLGLIVGLLLSLVAMGGCAPAGAGEGGITSFLPIILMLALVIAMFYFLMIKPMRQREKRHDELVEELSPGDRVITAGGIYGQVESISEDSIVLKVESGAKIRVTKGGIISRPETEGLG